MGFAVGFRVQGLGCLASFGASTGCSSLPFYIPSNLKFIILENSSCAPEISEIVALAIPSLTPGHPMVF